MYTTQKAKNADFARENSSLDCAGLSRLLRLLGVSRVSESPGRDILSAADFGKFIGVSREVVRVKHQRNEVLGLKGAKRGPRFPKWQVTSDGGLLPELPTSAVFSA